MQFSIVPSEVIAFVREKEGKSPLHLHYPFPCPPFAGLHSSPYGSRRLQAWKAKLRTLSHL